MDLAITRGMKLRPRALALALVAAGCGSAAPEGGPAPNPSASDVDGTPEPVGAGAGHTDPTAIPVGTKLWATTNVSLRKGPSPADDVLQTVPQGDAVVTVNRTRPVDGFLDVRHGATEGFAWAAYLSRDPPAPAPPPSSARDGAVTRAKAGEGFSYWWGHGRWLLTGPTQQSAGSCSGSCPSCSHSGSYGADCSGFVAKLWQVPDSNSDVSVDSHPYSTYNFYNETTHWQPIARGSAQQADAFVYNDGSSGHVFLFEKGDPWGSAWAYEAKGCSYGIVHDLRTVTSSYKAIRRDGW